jgi:hypothetical protein
VNRRDFIARLLGTAAGAALGATLDLDKLLWVPKPIITVPTFPTGWIFRIADSANYGFGFTGFKPTNDLHGIVGQIMVRAPIVVAHPQLSRQLYGVVMR